MRRSINKPTAKRFEHFELGKSPKRKRRRRRRRRRSRRPSKGS